MGESLPDGTKGGYISPLRTNIQTILTGMQVKICIQKRNEEHQRGVIVYYGMAVASNNYHMFVGSLGFPITDQYTVYFWQRSSPSIATASRKTWLIRAQELRLKKCFHMHMVIFNRISSKWNSNLASSAHLDLVLDHEISCCPRQVRCFLLKKLKISWRFLSEGLQLLHGVEFLLFNG